ncbi:MAG: disulfide bond formation protein B [Caulobacteraceae bacterium]
MQSITRRWSLLAAAASAFMLAAAHAFETFGGLQPCILCLRQREVYWAALAVGLIGYAVARLRKAPSRTNRAVAALLAVIFLVGVGVAVYHAGAEWKFWPGPAACGAGTGALATASDMAAMLNGAKGKAPHCDEAAWVFAGLSMAGWNALAYLALAALSVWAALTAPPPRPREDVL